MKGALLRHTELPIVASPSGLPSQHIITEQIGSKTLFLGQQWLKPGEKVLRHTHPCEEGLMFLSGTGEATLGDDIVPITGGCSLYVPAELVHGFRNTGDTDMHVVVTFPVPRFAETSIIE